MVYDAGLPEGIMFAVYLHVAKFYFSIGSEDFLDIERGIVLRDPFNENDILIYAFVHGWTNLFSVAQTVTPFSTTFEDFEVAQLFSCFLHLNCIFKYYSSFGVPTFGFYEDWTSVEVCFFQDDLGQAINLGVARNIVHEERILFRLVLVGSRTIFVGVAVNSVLPHILIRPFLFLFFLGTTYHILGLYF